jgi:shikimate kinase
MQSVKKIFICGFMGAGKTTFLKKFSNSEFELIDLDESILKDSTYKDLLELIEEIGWETFRKLEFNKLKKILSDNEKVIVALGGGAFSGKFQSLVGKENNNFTVWLNTPLEECLLRVSTDNSRPLIKKGEDFLRNLYSQRLKDYKNCDLVLNQKEQESVKTIKDLISLMPTN